MKLRKKRDYQYIQLIIKNNFKILSHSFKGTSQILEIKNNNSIKNVTLNLIGKIQLKNLLMAIIAAKKTV